MQATLTSKGQITIPLAIRKRLGLKVGQVLDFDEEAPFVKAVVHFDEAAMRSVVGIAAKASSESSAEQSSAEWLDDTRGEVELPPERP